MGPKLHVGARTAYLRRRNLAYSFCRSSGKAITSIMMTYLAKGNCTISIGMTTVSTLAAILMTPRHGPSGRRVGPLAHCRGAYHGLYLQPPPPSRRYAGLAPDGPLF
ncbi:MAG: hypothetical protein DSY90_13915 [Deltaproteobacteria bacterium]|nr:MAG: hypothetical protein DSY90_13915 [Deltaproteobacteria bacterium]